MLTTKTVKIKIVEELTNDYIESNLRNLGYDVLRWAITNVEDDFYILDIAVVEK